MYSPPTGGAARTASATIDKQHTSNRRFIICGEEDYLCGAGNSQVKRETYASSRRKRQANGPRGRPISKLCLPVWIQFSAYEVIPCLASSDQRKLIAAN